MAGVRPPVTFVGSPETTGRPGDRAWSHSRRPARQCDDGREGMHVTDKDGAEWLAERFEAHRGHLQAVAYRMLGSANDAEDAVQEAWLRTSRAGAGGIENLGGWLTTVVARVCLDMLRSRKSRREEALEPHEPRLAANHRAGGGPEKEALLADSIGVALT